MKGNIIAYCRVSTVEQNDQRQVENISKKYDIDKWFREKVSAKDTNRKELQAMLNYIREGDTIVVSEFSRLARNTQDLLNITKELDDKGVNLISLKESIDTSTSTGKLMLTMIGAINEFERNIIRERQAEGIEIAKRLGKYKGRKRKEIDDEFIEYYNRYMKRDLTKVKFAEYIGVTRSTLDKMIKRYEEKLDQE